MHFIIAALDGQLKHEDTNLASSTLIPDQTPKENLGIIVQYKVRYNDGGGFNDHTGGRVLLFPFFALSLFFSRLSRRPSALLLVVVV